MTAVVGKFRNQVSCFGCQQRLQIDVATVDEVEVVVAVVDKDMNSVGDDDDDEANYDWTIMMLYN